MSKGYRFLKGAKRSSGMSSMTKKIAVCVVLVAISSTLQGCMLGQLFSHPTPAWQEKTYYWNKFQFIPEGKSAKDRLYNSCEVPNIPKAQMCSGNGECQPWQSDIQVTGGGETMMFCKCYRDYADPECRTRRKSQFTAYFLSVFLGIFGADHFYLASFYTGFAKLASFGGLGVWWIYDIVRIGSSPVYADEYRLAYDLPHWLYVLFTVTFFSCVGFFSYVMMTRAVKFEKAKGKFLRKEEEIHQMRLHESANGNPEDSVGMPTFASYPLPMPHPDHAYNGYGAVPETVKRSGNLNPFSPYAVFQHATAGYGGPPGKFNGRAQSQIPGDFAARANCATPDQYNAYEGGGEYGY